MTVESEMRTLVGLGNIYAVRPCGGVPGWMQWRPVHNTMLNNALRCVVDACRKHNARIDSDPLFAVPYVAIFRNGLMRVMVSMAARNDLAGFVASSKHIKTLRSTGDKFHTVFNRAVLCCTSKLVSSGSFGWLTFYCYAYLSWKGEATYVDGTVRAYSAICHFRVE